MSGFETASIVVPYRRRCEDRVGIVELGEGVVIAVADGAGGTGAGDQAAETVIREIAAAAALEHDAAAWWEFLQQIDFRMGGGESTGVVACCSPRGLMASLRGIVGNSNERVGRFRQSEEIQ